MKKFLPLFILLYIALTNLAHASHLKGGEITWECNGNGQYVFYLKLYHDCNGIQLGLSQQLNSTGGGVSIIPLILVGMHDLTQTGCGNSCATPNGFFGALEEDVWRSNPVTLSGTPPTTGWDFYWDYECCRNNNYLNTTQGSQMVIHSKMYAHDGMDANPCYDSSPLFLEKPIPSICIGYPFTYNILGYDQNHDSLVYNFDYPYDNGGTGNGLGGNLSYTFPYSIIAPIPGNPSINHSTGELTFFPQTGTLQGNYNLVIKASSYRCGNLLAEVSREILVVLQASGCSGVISPSGSSINTPPQVSPAPFQDPNTGLYTSYIDTVNVGDTVDFTLSVTEFEQNISNSQYQNFWIDAVGYEMDSGSVAPFVNCALPPCAHMNNPTPQGPFQVGHQMHFTWVTDCAHPLNSCGKEYTPYYFVIKVKDDGCPAAAQNNIAVTVVVRGLEIIKNGDTLSVVTPYTNLQWYFNGVAIPGATNNTYVITVPGDYEVTAVTQIGCTVSSVYRTSSAVGLTEVNKYQNFLSLSPNPVISELKINFSSLLEEQIQLKVIDAFGRSVIESKAKSFVGKNTIDLKTEDLPNGLYILMITGKQNNYSAKFLVVK